MPKSGIDLDFSEPAPWDLPQNQGQADESSETFFAIYDTAAIEREIQKFAPPLTLDDAECAESRKRLATAVQAA